MSRLTLYIVASVLILAGLALIVLGLRQESYIWQAGLGAVALAMLLSLTTRWVPAGETENEDGPPDA